MTYSGSKKILVLMSGGVDSSTAAALLKEAGHDVAGVYLKLWDASSSRHPEPSEGSRDSSALPQNDGHLGEPCWAQEMRDAARVAAKLGIPFEVWDVTEDYKKRVLENFYSEYAAGRTPNPDVLCNSEIKFGVGLDRALAAGYEFVATGHYARIEEMKNEKCKMQNGGSLRPTSYVLCTAVDLNKDQSYFLWRLMQEQLAHVMFPIGEYTKPQVRALAEKFGLHNAKKKDSQGVCFLGKIDLKEFLYREARPPLTPPRGGGENDEQFPPLTKGRLGGVRQSGPIVDVHGTLLGLHDGLAHFTIGQRHGTKLGGTLSVPKGHAKRGGTGPYFVVEKDLATNTLIVANTEDEPKYRAVECRMENVEWRMQNEEWKVGGEVRCMARARYRAPLIPVTVYFQTSKFGSMEGRVVFDEPAQAVAPGQSIVFYEGDKVIGGGVIDSVTLQNSPNYSNLPNSPNKISNASNVKIGH